MEELITYNATPIQQIQHDLFNNAGVQLAIKREDLNHPYISGNKWWKLKYNLQHALQTGTRTILTFGGAYSNHIYATAAAANQLGLNSIGIIRGEETLPLNATLCFAKAKGMELHYISRSDYRRKNEASFVDALKQRLGDFHLIPEGGTNAWAIDGCQEFAANVLAHLHYDYICMPVGTGGTIAGVIKGVDEKKKIIGFTVLKDGHFLKNDIQRLVNEEKSNWEIITSYHFGGYAKTTPGLLHFIQEFEDRYDIPLDPVYTGKMLYGILDLIKKDFFIKESKILVIHTGGLQGRTL